MMDKSDGIEKVSKLEKKGLHKTVTNGKMVQSRRSWTEEYKKMQTSIFFFLVRMDDDKNHSHGRTTPIRGGISSREEEQQQQYEPYNSNRPNRRTEKKTNAQGGLQLPPVLDVAVFRNRYTKALKSRKGTQAEELKHHKRCSSRRELIRAFVNNQSSTNLLLKQKRKVIEAKVAISLPEASAPKECKQENQVKSFINQVKVSLSCYRYIIDEVIMKMCSLTSCTVYYSVSVTSSCKVLLYWSSGQVDSYIMRNCNKPSKNIMETFQGNLMEKADSNGSDEKVMKLKVNSTCWNGAQRTQRTNELVMI
ncbi:hypothetical protein M514_06643, partial [Trichuris suis]